MDRDQILGLNIQELKEKLGGLGLATTGRKPTLQDRLLEHFGLNVSDNEDSDCNDAASQRSAVSSVRKIERSVFTLRDIEDSLTSFSGSGQPSIEQWLEEFEENAEAVSWNELQKFIYAKQLLKGAAKIFVRSQRGINSWSSLKQALKAEFGVVVSSIEIHRTLRNSRKRQGEDLMEYLYSLMEIGKSINLDDTSLIEYFIEGIPDSKAGKANLYQAKTVKDLKEQVKVYEKIKVPVSKPQFVNANKTSSTSSNIASSSSGSSAKKCYNCGDDSHFVRDCPRKKVKCFKCGVEGHRATECSTVGNLVKKEKNANMMKTKAAVKPNK
ncbi:uncharacterized protein LOC120779381 [Bactrocera tryoni]|uniref:uncharacterized protein LOC120779371 n=1 Tax=Bactrocera tryoni TaxID=59916 RepID=UPI001A968A44|nr:uncharacterized protein LOC120779371 [Bactrocera tryoni]XP_039967511.1 uncharacterized protein LOC120779381 [Bactrocera tryoni]